MKRTFWIYLLLVVAPLGVLGGVLRLGRGLGAPPRLEGTWQLAEGGGVLRLDQSGVLLTLRFPDAPGGRVRLRGDSLVGEGGWLRGRRSADRIVGTWRRPGCGDCVMQPFVAERPAAAVGGG